MPKDYRADVVSFEDVTVEHETSPGEPDVGALLCVIHGEKKWVPKSQIHADSEVYEKDTEGTLVVTRWWAVKNDLD